MKHWDGRDRPEAAIPLSPEQRERLRALLAPPAGRPKVRASPGSLVGLALAIGLLVGLTLLLAPASPISPKILD